MSLFFIEIQNFGLGQTNWANQFWGIWGIFGTVSPLFMFSITQSLLLQKTKPLFPHPKYLGRKLLGFNLRVSIVCVSINDITFDWSAVLLLVKKSYILVYILLYATTPAQHNKLKWPRL